MKYLKSIIIILTTFCLCGYTSYYTGIEGTNTEGLYGRFKYQNMVQAKNTIKHVNNDTQCSGLLFLTQPAHDNQKKIEPGIPFARVNCSDDRVIELKWDKNNLVTGIDQYNQKYSFNQVKRKDYKKFIKNSTQNKDNNKNKDKEKL